MVACAAVARLYADAGYDGADIPVALLARGYPARHPQAGQPHGPGLGQIRCIVVHANAWLLANKRADRRHDKLGAIIDALLTAACIVIVAARLVAF